MKEIIGKKKCNNETLPKPLIVDKIEIHDAKANEEKLYGFFVHIGPNLADKIPQYDLTLESYLPTVNTVLDETVLSEDEFEETFKSLKRNGGNALGNDGLDVIIITCELIKKPLLKIFNESINLSIFPENMKIAKGNTNFQIWQKRITNKLSANFRTFVFL